MKFHPICPIDAANLIVPPGPNGVPSPDTWQCTECGAIYTQDEIQPQYEAAKHRPPQPKVKAKQLEMWGKGK